MAKGNMFQGMARGKVGDVVFSRLNGEQVSRVRNRNPRNPRTNAQLYQRAIMATVMQIYSAGKVIFDHSFQGKAVGAENQREFMKLNAKNLRNIIANDINTNAAIGAQLGRVVAPGSTMPTPFAAIISQGSYPQNFFTETTSASVPTFAFPEKETDETCAAYCARTGLVPGDIYTVVAISAVRGSDSSETLADALKYQKSTNFGYLRLQVKDNALTDTTAISNNLAEATAVNGVPFVITDAFNSTCNVIMFNPSQAMTLSGLGFNNGSGALGMIRSRKDSDLRSNSQLVFKVPADGQNATGIASSYILDIWTAGTEALGDSDLILEGGGQ